MTNIRNAKPRGASDGGIEITKKPRPEFKQFPKYLEPPVLPVGEDEYSYKRHMQLLQHEEGKISPDMHVINNLMTKTYAETPENLERTTSNQGIIEGMSIPKKM